MDASKRRIYESWLQHAKDIADKHGMDVKAMIGLLCAYGPYEPHGGWRTLFEWRDCSEFVDEVLGGDNKGSH